ncbi:unnamed protein product, partial [Ectocarpus fasciculatus]
RPKVEIPWSKLGSRPVKVLLQGVSVLVGPVDRTSWGDQEVRERRFGIKRAALEKAEAATRKEKEGGKGAMTTRWVVGGYTEKGFVEKLVQRIVDSIEINVADIHIRYD